VAAGIFFVADCWCYEGSGVADLSLVLREFFFGLLIAVWTWACWACWTWA
jgi:hypothetical protein